MQIPLSQGKFAVVDPEAHALFSEFRWSYRANRNQGPGCAVRHVKIDSRDRLAYLHREIMNAPAGTEVIFLNHDTLDCRKGNLKLVGRHQGNWHHRVRCDSKSGIKGLRYNPSSGKWYASITRNGVYHYLGTFDTQEAAWLAYQNAEERLAQTIASPHQARISNPLSTQGNPLPA